MKVDTSIGGMDPDLGLFLYGHLKWNICLFCE
jgi:hypothetical protein